MTLTVIGFRAPRCDCISPLCVMKFTHILKAWLAYILYWHSGNMFSLLLYLSVFSSLCTFLSFISPSPPPPLVRLPPLLCLCCTLKFSCAVFCNFYLQNTRPPHCCDYLQYMEKLISFAFSQLSWAGCLWYLLMHSTEKTRFQLLHHNNQPTWWRSATPAYSPN